MLRALSIVAALAGLAASLPAQTSPYPDTYKVNYFSGAGSYCPGGTVQIVNVGTSGNLYADIYVFDANQELSECCSCFTTPDGLVTLDINQDLDSNPLTGVILTTGAIKIVSSTTPRATDSVKPAPGIRAWATHIQDPPRGRFVTETPFSDSTLSQAELNALQRQCHAIALVGSGRGVCGCGTGTGDL